jgi:[acyl-carrier-protein] S-malonyltransferase
MTLAVVCPGQGSQFAGMADGWLEHPVGRKVIEEVSDAMERDIAALSRDEEALKNTEVVQPALFACDLAAFRVLGADGVRFSGAAGHSLGEFVALVAAGALELRPALELVLTRGRAMQRASEERPGTMTALMGVGAEDGASIADAARGDDVLVVANENSPKQVVLSGSLDAIDRAEVIARERGAKAVRLRVAGAFHSTLMDPAVADIDDAIARLEFATPTFSVVPNVTGTPTSDPAELRNALRRHVVSPVRWEATIRSLADAGVDTIVEAGPGDVLTKLARRTVEDLRAVPVRSPEEAAALAAEAGISSRGGRVRGPDDILGSCEGGARAASSLNACRRETAVRAQARTRRSDREWREILRRPPVRGDRGDRLRAS